MIILYIYLTSILILSLQIIFDILRYTYVPFKRLKEYDKYSFIFFYVMLGDIRIKKLYITTILFMVLIAPISVVINFKRILFGENIKQRKNSTQQILSMFSYDVDELYEFYSNKD